MKYPFIYVKTYTNPRLLVVIDTGCGAHNGKEGHVDELKTLIEEQIGSKYGEDHYEFMVICTHCHFDHIGGIEAFAKADVPILASAYQPSFLESRKRGANSLCDNFNMSTPKYEVTKYCFYGEPLQHNDVDLKLLVLHTPGHTPDSMAIYDAEERWLFTGDTLYRRKATMPWGDEQDVPILLCLQSDWRNFVASIDKLRAFAQMEDRGAPDKQPLRLAAGHTTSDAPAVELLQAASTFVHRVEAGRVPILCKMTGDEVAPGGTLGDAEFWFWHDEGDPEFDLIAPESIRKDFPTTPSTTAST
jgi:glyoxylase-like metal-dependent hydrolase (beta-lactamase superfamily II)